MPLSKVLMALGELTLDLLVTAQPSTVALVFLFFIGAWAWEPRNGRVLCAALALTLLTTQA